MKKIGVLGMLLYISVGVFGQSVKGVIADPVDGNVIPGATVELLIAADSSVKSTAVSDTAGAFSFGNLLNGNYVLRASFVGFENLIQPFTITDSVQNVDLQQIYLPKKTETLEGVVIVSKPPAVSQKGDTTQFSASQYKVNPDATVEDLIKKMPGITVDRQGNVTAQGESVKKVTVDGKDFFGEDATMALRNLPSEVVDKIQLFDRLSDQAQLTGFDDGNSQKSINIVTKSGIKNGQFGRIFAGYGTDQRYQAGGNVSFFNGDRRLSFVGNFNNINQQNFAQQDLLGVTGSGGGRGGRGGGGGGFRGGGGGDFMVGQSPGISKTNAFGINYGDKWGKKVDVSGSYFFNNSFNTNESQTYRQTTINADTIQYTGNNTYTTSNNNNHRFNLRLEYKIDSNNTLFIIPSVNFQNNNSYSTNTGYSYYNNQDSINSSSGYYNSHREGYNIGNNIMYRHSFAKQGRSLSASVRFNFNKNDGYSYNNNQLYFYSNNIRTDSLLNQYRNNKSNGRSYSARLAYTEPLGKQSLMEFEYNYERQNNNSDQRTYDFDGNEYSLFVPNLSNEFYNYVTTNTVEVNYRLGHSRDNQFSVGFDLQNSRLESERIYPNNTSIDQSFNTILPNLRLMKKVGRYGNVRVFYRARNDFPSINQLQDVVDNSNPLNVSSGNPALKQSYTHFGSARYSYTNTRNNNSFFANIFARFTNDYITTATFIPRQDSILYSGDSLKAGSQYSMPVNLNGYKSINSFLTYSVPLKFLKSNLNVNAGFNYEDRPGMINSLMTRTKNTSISGGVVLGSNISEYIDFNLSYNANFSNAVSTANNTNNRYVNQSGGLFANLLSKNGWFLQNDLSYQSYTGLSQSLNQSYWLWNAAIGKKFLKNQAGELKLSVFDLLKQNQSIARTIGDNYIEDSRSQVLQQYFMLTFTYSLRNFGKGRSSSNSGDGEQRGRPEWRNGAPGRMPAGGGMRPMGGGPMF